MITDSNVAATRIHEFLSTGLMPTIDGDRIPLKADSICIHGDSPHAVAMARHLKKSLTDYGIKIQSFLKT